MWAHYRRTAIATQLMIMAAMIVLYFSAKPPVRVIALFVVVMELGALIGAWWGARLKRKLNNDLNKLPLH